MCYLLVTVMLSTNGGSGGGGGGSSNSSTSTGDSDSRASRLSGEAPLDWSAPGLMCGLKEASTGQVAWWQRSSLQAPSEGSPELQPACRKTEHRAVTEP